MAENNHDNLQISVLAKLSVHDFVAILAELLLVQ